jgi:hypothetical protein
VGCDRCCVTRIHRRPIRRSRTASRSLANVSHVRLVTGGRYDEAHLQARRVDNPYPHGRGVRGMGTTQDLCPGRSTFAKGRSSEIRAGAWLCLAARFLPVAAWRLRLETRRLGTSSGEACDVGLSSMGEQPPRVVQHAWTLEKVGSEVQMVRPARPAGSQVIDA